MDPMENNSTDKDNSEELQNQLGGPESSVGPSLSRAKKSWGFRRTTIARREFMDEVGGLAHSPPPVRRGRSRRSDLTAEDNLETDTPQRATPATRSVIDDLEWSAPSSPGSEESKPATESSAGGSFDPSLWQNFGSAFHTAFTLLGGSEDLPLGMPDTLAVPDILEAADAIEAPPMLVIEETEMHDNIESVDDVEMSQPVAHDNVARGELDDVVMISSQEDDSDELTLMQIKEQLESKGRQGDTRTRGGKGGRGKARGRGRGRGRKRGRGRGRGRGRAVEHLSSIAHDEDDDEVIFVSPVEQQLQEEEKVNNPHGPAAIGISPTNSDVSLSPAQRSSSDCMYIESDLDQFTDAAPGQYDDAPQEMEEKKEEEEKKDNINGGEAYSGISNSKGYDSNALYCICRQKHNDRFMICCDSCQEWFHGSCVGIGETRGREMEREGQEYNCPPCTIKKQSHLQPEPDPQPEPELDPQPEPEPDPQPEPEFSIPVCLTPSPSGEEGKGHEEQQALKETVVVVVEEEKQKEEQKGAPVSELKAEPEMETDISLPLCIGPGCPRQALPDSVYCGTDCILQHAAVTMKTLSVPKEPKPRGRPQRKAAAAARPAAQVQRSSRMSKRLSAKAEEEGEVKEVEEDDGGQKEASSPLACDRSLTEVQATSLPPSKFYSASAMGSKQVEADVKDVTQESPEDTSTNAPQPVAEPALPQSHSQEKTKEKTNGGVSKQQSVASSPCIPPNPEKSPQSPSAAAPRHHETGALMVSKTSYVIPKKQSVPQPPSSHVSASSQKPSSASTLLNETRNLPVPPAPSAPSSRPSQPNNQVRQSIQRSLTGILLKRLCDCEDLEMSESDVTKLVASIEMEMFDIFRNTDSKYMNKYRTIMFNLKDPRNTGLLYGVVRGEISSFRLVRMSQKDMQAIKASEPSVKETTEVKDAAAKATSLLQKPEAVKIDLPSLNPARPDRSAIASQEQKKSLPAPVPKTKQSQPSQSSALPDILACMLKDTTSEHKSHLFDLKCKICTGQMLAGDEEEPSKKKAKISETRDKYEPSWRRSAGDDSPLRAPPDSPDMDSPTSDPHGSCLDSPVLTIVESPASLIMDSPASPTLESPASPVMESPASPTPDTPKATVTKRAYTPAYTPVVIPAVSTVTITRRDPRTAANRFSAQSSGTPGPSNTIPNQPFPYAPLKDTRLAPPSAPASSIPPTKKLPKSILMKPCSSASPRLYGTSPRTLSTPESPADDETTQFLAKQEIVWKGFLNMLTVAKFVTKAYLVSGSAESLKADLPDTIQVGGRIMPETVWDYVEKLKTSVTKELCVMRFQPATEEEEVAYVSLFSYFSSRRRFGVVANSNRAIKDLYLVPLSAKESIPPILQPLEGPGLEKTRPNLLLGLAIVQKVKRPGSLPQETEEKRPKVLMPKDPMWIPKPPVLYGSDKLEIFQPYDPETPHNTNPLDSPSYTGSPSEPSSSGSVTIPSPLPSMRANPSDVVATTQSASNNITEKNPTIASKTPLQTILNLFGNKQTESVVPSAGSYTTTTTASIKKRPLFSQVSGPMVDPIVQQYGQKSKVKKIEEEENDFDRPYDPEEEYDPAEGYGRVAPQTIEKAKTDFPAISVSIDDDVAYDPEDETIFADIQSDIAAKPPVLSQTPDSPSCPTPVSTQAVKPAPSSTPAQTSSPAGVMASLPIGAVVVSAATLTEQQRMLEELNKQIEEQKRQLKEQEEALRQQREAVGMFMAHFSVSDSLMSPPQKPLPISQLSSLPSGLMQTESKPSESTDKAANLTEYVDSSNADSQTFKQEDTTAIPNLRNDTYSVQEQDETQENVKESDKYSSAGEIEDSDVAYDPEDESLFDEIQEDVFQSGNTKTCDSSRKGTPQDSNSRKRRLSPKRRSHRERDHHRSPSRKSQHRSPSHSRRRRERDRHRRSERDRSRHRARDQSERQGRHRKEHSARRHSRGRRRSPSSPGITDSVSLSPKWHRGLSPKPLEKPLTLATTKADPDGHQLQGNLVENPDKDSSSSSCKLVHNVKLEISKPLTSQEHQKTLVSDFDETAECSSTQVDKSSQQETLFDSKLESTIPLREIDPPIRDSPESPDPEPQFVKPCSVEKKENIKDTETYTSVSMPLQVENNCPAISDQQTISNMLWPNVKCEISNARTNDVRALGVRAQAIAQGDKLIAWKTPDLKHPEILGQQGGQSSATTCLNIPASGPEIEPVTRCAWPGMSGPDIRNLDHGHWAPQIHLRETGGRFPGPKRGLVQENESTSMQGGMGGSGQQDEKRDAVMGMPLSRRPGLDKRISVSQEPLSAMDHLCPDTRKPIVSDERRQDVTCLQRDLLVLKPEEHRLEPESPNVKPGAMEVGKDESFQSPQIGGRVTDIVGRVGDQKDRGESLHTGGIVFAMRARGVRDRCPDVRSPGPSFMSSGGVQIKTRQDGSPVLEERRPGKGDFQLHGRHSDMNRVGADRERSLGSNASARLGGLGLRADRPSPGVTDERRAPQRGQGHRSGSPRGHFKEQPDFRPERSLPVPYMSESETMQELRPYTSEGSYIGHGQHMDSMIASDERSDRSDSQARTSGRCTGEMDPNTSVTDMQGRIMQGLPLERRSEQIGDRGPIQNITNPDWRGPGLAPVGPDIRDQRSQNKRLGPHMSDVDWSGPGSDIQDDLSGPDRSGPVRGGPFIQDEWRVHQPDRRGSNMEDLRHDRRGSGCPDVMAPGPERRRLDMGYPVHDRRRSEGPDFMGPGSERRGPEMEVPTHAMRGPDFMEPGPEIEVPIHDRRGPGGPDFWRPEPERRGPGGPDFRGPGPERRGLYIEGPGPDRKGPEGPDFSGPGPDRRGPAIGGLGADRRPGGPDFRGPEPERRGPGGPDFRRARFESSGLDIEGPGPNRRGPGCADFRGPEPERRGPALQAPGPDRRGPGGLEFSGPGPDRRRHGGPDSRGPGPERRGPVVGGPGPGERGPGGPDFRRPGPERRGPIVGGPGPDERGPGGPDFRRPGPHRRDLAIDVPGPDRRGPDFCGLGPDRRGPALGDPEPDRSQPGGPDFRGPGSDKRGQGGPDLRGPGRDWKGPILQSQGPDRRGSCDENTGGLCPDKRGQYLRGPGPDFIGLGPEQTGPGTEGPHPHYRGQNLRGSEIGYPNMEGTGPDRRGADMRVPRPENSEFCMEGLEPNRRGPKILQHSSPNMEDPVPQRRGSEGPNFRGPVPEIGASDMGGTGNSRGYPGGPQFRGPEQDRFPVMEGPEFDRRGPNFREKRRGGTIMEDPGPDREGLRRPDFRRPGRGSRGLDIEGPGPERLDPGGPSFREPRSESRDPDMDSPGTDWRQKGPNTGGPRHRRDICVEGDFGGSEGPDTVGLGPGRRGRNLRGPGRNIVRPGPGMRMLNPGDRCEGPGLWVSAPDRRGTHAEEQWSDEKGPNTENLDNDWNRHGNTGPGSTQDSPDGQQQEHRQAPPMELRGLPLRGRGGSHLRGPGNPNMEYGNEWREPERGGSGPNRRGRGQFFRGARDPDNRGYDNGPDMRTRQGSDIKEGPDMGNDWRPQDHRVNMRGLSIDGPGHRGGSDLINPYPNTRGFEVEGLDRRGIRGPDSRGLGPDRCNTINEGPEFNSRGPKATPPHFNSPHQVARFQGPSEPHSTTCSEKSFPGFDNLQNQQAAKPQRHRGALLPTPTEGLIHFPNHLKNPDGFSSKREWSRGRSVHRESVREHRHEREKSPAAKRSTPIDLGKREGKKEGNETDKRGIQGAGVETKTNRSIDNNGNKSDVKPS